LSAPAELEQVRRRVDGGEVPVATVRTLLTWFRAQRRGSSTVWTIKRALRDLGLTTVPSFENAWIDSEIAFRATERDPSAPAAADLAGSREPLAGPAAQPSAAPQVAAPTLPAEFPPAITFPRAAPPADAGPPSPTGDVAPILPAAAPPTPGAANGHHDPVHRVGKLPAANNSPATVAPGVSLQKATTLMLLHDLSQLPVMQNERTIKGVVSWRSIGRHAAIHGPARTVDDCLEEAALCSSEDSVFTVAHLVHRHGYVLVRSPQRTLQGLVTAKDLSEQFGLLLEPFLLIGEIEGHLRALLEDGLPVDVVLGARDPRDGRRRVESVADLTFGEYKRLLEREENWAQLGLKLDRGHMVAALDELREIRNDVMHFQPEGLDDRDLRAVRELVHLLREVRRDVKD
jgi:CBS domain-containing protein